VVLPYFDALSKILPLMSYASDQLRSNKEIWAISVDEYQAQMEETGNEKI
jgi:hypothetical protein